MKHLFLLMSLVIGGESLQAMGLAQQALWSDASDEYSSDDLSDCFSDDCRIKKAHADRALCAFAKLTRSERSSKKENDQLNFGMFVVSEESSDGYTPSDESDNHALKNPVMTRKEEKQRILKALKTADYKELEGLLDRVKRLTSSSESDEESRQLGFLKNSIVSKLKKREMASSEWAIVGSKESVESFE